MFGCRMVSVQQIQSAIAEREEDLKLKFIREKIIERYPLDKSNFVPSADVALIITGVRRCGKSIFAYMLGKYQKCAYVNFEDERLVMKAEDLNKVLEAIYTLKGDVDFYIFDEIQNVLGWERFVSRLLPNKKIVITGSNARLLSKELATSLTGRHIDLLLFPFSFREMLSLKGFEPHINLTKDVAQTKKYLREYFEKGGFPLVYPNGNIFLLETYRDILERDVMQRYPIRHPAVIRELGKYLISNIAQEISYNKLKNIFSVKSVHTIKNYMMYLENAYLIFHLDRFSFKLKEQVLTPKKVYAIDHAMSTALGFHLSNHLDQIIENIVAVELLRRRRGTVEIYYWRDHQQREVDFLVKEGKKVRQLIQVCYDCSNPQTKEREVRSLLKASSELHCKKLTVITFEDDFTEKHGGVTISFIPIWRWLLNP